MSADFNPRPPRGERRKLADINYLAFLFQSTPSARRATSNVVRIVWSRLFQSTPSARRATLRPNVLKWSCRISIHALREESDGSFCTPRIAQWKISIHALREESDKEPATEGQTHQDFNPRPPRGERLLLSVFPSGPSYFNPRPPRGERLALCHPFLRQCRFQSTPSARRATGELLRKVQYV